MENLDITPFNDLIFQASESYRRLIIRTQSFPDGGLHHTPLNFLSDKLDLDLRCVARTLSLLVFQDDEISPEIKLHALQGVKNSLDAWGRLEGLSKQLDAVTFRNEADYTQTRILAPNEKVIQEFLTPLFKHCLKQAQNCQSAIDQVLADISLSAQEGSPPAPSYRLGVSGSVKASPKHK